MQPCDSCGMGRRRNRIAGGVLGALLVVVLISVGVQLWNVHQLTSDWLLWPKAVPSKVPFASRDYQCGPNPVPFTRSFDGLTVQSKTAGGADIYAIAPGNGTATWIVIKTDRTTYTCNLVGGP